MNIIQYSDLYYDKEKSIIVLDNSWQYPARTEQAAYGSVCQYIQSDTNCIYIAYPWATLIDGMRNNKEDISYLLMELYYLRKFIIEQRIYEKEILTVCQHILMLDFIYLMKYVGVTTVFWSHKINSINNIMNIIIKPFPLYPAQTDGVFGIQIKSLDECRNALKNKKSKYLANFIGSYNPKIYLSDVRQWIFNDNHYSEFLVIERKQWHFERIVYAQQIGGDSAQYSELVNEQKHKDEYLNAIRNSDFTFCPTGTGPNSIRIYESLCLGSIPVILTKTLSLVGNSELWDKACIIVEDSRAGYENAKKIIFSMTEDEILLKKFYGLELLNIVAPNNYANLIFNN